MVPWKHYRVDTDQFILPGLVTTSRTYCFAEINMRSGTLEDEAHLQDG